MEALQNSLNSFRFASPFLALGAAIVFLVFLFFAMRRRKTEKHSHLEFLPEGKTLADKFWRKLFFVLPALAVISVLMALANPQIVKETTKPLEARDIVIVLDTSGSMMVGFYPNDILPKFERTSLGVAWEFLREFIKMRNGDRIAVIPYDNPRGYIARGFTDDQDQLLSIFNKEEIEGVYDYLGKDTIDRYAIHGGTNTPNALGLAEAYFERESKAKTKLIILVTDLDDDSLAVPVALSEVGARGIKVYTIGIVKGKFSQLLEILKSGFQDEGLRFFEVQNRAEWMQAIKSIDQMEESVVGAKETVVLYSLSWVFVIAALFFAVIFMVFCEKFKKIP